MKRILAMVLALTLLFSFGGCSLFAGEGKARVAVFWYEESDVYLTSVREHLEKKLGTYDIRFKHYFAAGNQSKQIDQIKAAVADGVDMLVVNQVTAGSLDTAMDILTIAKDLPVVFFNRYIGTEMIPDVPFFEDHLNSCYIGTDAPKAGHLQGKLIGDYVLEHYNDIDLNRDGTISYALFKGDEADVSAIYRTLYSVEDANTILQSAGKPELSYFDQSAPEDQRYQVDLAGKWSSKAAAAYMEANLKTYNEENRDMIELVICNNDNMAEGVVSVLKEHGYNQPGGHTVPVFGVDATEEGKALIAEGSMAGTVKQDAEGMASAIAQTANAIIDGKTPTEALAGLEDPRFSIAVDSASKLYVAYSPYSAK